MNAVEWVAVAIFGALGIRSLVHWLRRPLPSDDRREQLLFAVFVTCRAGLWMAVAGLFALYASIDVEGRAFADEAGDLRWYLIVLGALAGGQFVSGFLLGSPAHGRDGDPGA
ncbi:MAG TPA: hypothetical protein VFQ40_01705 [Actinomycetota bacterium]|nr:hypothetical protein [Actinomycetota bacterium]